MNTFIALRCLPGAWVVLRLDGHGFTRFTEKGFEKPIDLRFQDWMRTTSQDAFRKTAWYLCLY